MKKTILITGSSRGIGKEIARKFAFDKNYNIIINCKNSEEKLKETYEELNKINSNILMFKCDVSDNKQVAEMFEKIYKNFDSVDVLINNAGVSSTNLFNLHNYKDFNYIIQNNILSFLNCTNIAIKNMIKNKSGCIINISSIWGVNGGSCEVLYSMSKGAMNAFTKALAKESGPSNIRVNAIACGLINTSMNNHLNDEEIKTFIEDIPLGRIGQPEDVANLCYYLSNENLSSYLTGQVITLDGGYL